MTSIATAADEAGVSAALVHNRHQNISEDVGSRRDNRYDKASGGAKTSSAESSASGRIRSFLAKLSSISAAQSFH